MGLPEVLKGKEAYEKWKGKNTGFLLHTNSTTSRIKFADLPKRALLERGMISFYCFPSSEMSRKDCFQQYCVYPKTSMFQCSWWYPRMLVSRREEQKSVAGMPPGISYPDTTLGVVWNTDDSYVIESWKGAKIVCARRESNPRHLLGRQKFYH